MIAICVALHLLKSCAQADHPEAPAVQSAISCQESYPEKTKAREDIHQPVSFSLSLCMRKGKEKEKGERKRMKKKGARVPT